MNITKEQVAENHLKVVLNIEPSDYLPKVNDEIKSLSKKISIDGFRPGKVPPGLAKKLYGDSVLAEELNKMISESLRNYIKENDLKVFGEPLPLVIRQNDISVQRPEEYAFGFEVGLLPDFELPALDQKTFSRKTLKISDKMIDEEVDRLRTRFGDRETPDTIAGDDILVGKFEELNEEGAVNEQGITSNSSFNLSNVKDEIIKQQLLTLMKGEVIELNLKAAFGNDDELIIHHILKTDHRKAEHMGDRFRFTLSNIVRIIKAELNQEFFDKAFGPGEVSSEEQMRGRLSAEMKSEYAKYTDSKLDHDIQDYLINETSMEMPDEFLRRLINATRDKEKDELSDEEFGEAKKQIRWDLISGRLATLHSISPTEEEMKEGARRDVFNYFGQGASYFNDNQESLDKIVDSLLKEEKNALAIHGRVVNEKLFTLLRSIVIAEEQELDEHEFSHH